MLLFYVVTQSSLFCSLLCRNCLRHVTHHLLPKKLNLLRFMIMHQITKQVLLFPRITQLLQRNQDGKTEISCSVYSCILCSIFQLCHQKVVHSNLETSCCIQTIRRLMPKSSVLLTNINALDIEDDMEKPKVQQLYYHHSISLLKPNFISFILAIHSITILNSISEYKNRKETSNNQ